MSVFPDQPCVQRGGSWWSVMWLRDSILYRKKDNTCRRCDNISQRLSRRCM